MDVISPLGLFWNHGGSASGGRATYDCGSSVRLPLANGGEAESELLLSNVHDQSRAAGTTSPVSISPRAKSFVDREMSIMEAGNKEETTRSSVASLVHLPPFAHCAP
ncbi:hypothetical protein VTO73DRAFT_15333 [Trametes versicolor]